MDPKTGTFMSMDTYQGNMHDPMSLHKYMYANANPINNIDPTGMMTDGLYIHSILISGTMLNYSMILDKLQKGAYSILFIESNKKFTIAVLTDDTGGCIDAIASGRLATIELLEVADSALAMDILKKALPRYGTKESIEAFLKAAEEGDAEEMLEAGTSFMLEIFILFSACFDGDTLVAIEDGFKRIDEIQAEDRVWSYNVETSEKKLKRVKQIFVKESDEILHLEASEGEIDATTNHPFYVIGKGWVAAGDLVVGDEVHTLNNNTGTITGFKFEKLDKPISVYNIEVEDFHSYFVGNGVLVHNDYYRAGHHPLPDGINSVDEMNLIESVRGRYTGPEFLDWIQSQNKSTEGWVYMMDFYGYFDSATEKERTFIDHYWIKGSEVYHHVR
jgi:hypothetical protein